MANESMRNNWNFLNRAAALTTGSVATKQQLIYLGTQVFYSPQMNLETFFNCGPQLIPSFALYQ